MISRRKLLQAGGLWLAGLVVGRSGWSAETSRVIEILMSSDLAGSHVVFDPIGLLVRPGQRVRWVNDGNNVHTATAYHPDNAQHALRIPPGASPWDSGYLVNPGDSFEVELTIEGIYDYFCTPHEVAGMVGRIVVSSSYGGQPPTYEPYPDDHGNLLWRKVPEAALRNFPSVEKILKNGRVTMSKMS